MITQPLLLQTPNILPGQIPGFAPRVQDPAAVAGSGRTEQAHQSDRAHGSKATLNPADSVEISEEANSLLADQLGDDEQREVERLRTQDQQVRAHEQAHLAAAGPYARGGPTYKYTTGPDGKQYAVGGEVQIDTSSVPGDPEETIRKAQTIRTAALAPAEPSSQDRAVAAAAAKLETQAREELRQQQQQPDGETAAALGSDVDVTSSAAIGLAPVAGTAVRSEPARGASSTSNSGDADPDSGLSPAGKASHTEDDAKALILFRQVERAAQLGAARGASFDAFA